MKQCSSCDQEKSLEQFPKNSRGKFGRGQKCKQCSAEISASYLKDNYFKVYAKKYSVDENTIKEVLNREVCDICGDAPLPNRRHNIDHCHSTNKVRGLLCDPCNLALGKFKDDPLVLQKAIKYLENSTN